MCGPPGCRQLIATRATRGGAASGHLRQLGKSFTKLGTLIEDGLDASQRAALGDLLLTTVRGLVATQLIMSSDVETGDSRRVLIEVISTYRDREQQPAYPFDASRPARFCASAMPRSRSVESIRYQITPNTTSPMSSPRTVAGRSPRPSARLTIWNNAARRRSRNSSRNRNNRSGFCCASAIKLRNARRTPCGRRSLKV